MKTFLGNRLVNAIAIAVVAVLVIVVLSVWQYQRIRDTGLLIRHSTAIFIQTQRVQSTVNQFESNSKDYLLTRDSRYLDTAQRFASRLPGELDSLRTIIGEDPALRRLADSLQFYFNGMRQGIDPDHSRRMQSVIDQFANDQRQFIETRRNVNQLKAAQLQSALWVVTGLVALMAVIIFRLVRLNRWREREERERLLQSSEEKYKMLFDKSPLPKWIYDEETMRILEVNDTAIRDYGYTRTEFLGMTIADIRPAEDVPQLIEDVESIRHQPGALRNGYWRHVKKNGEVIDVSVTAHSITFEGYRARMVAVSDITDRRRYETQLQRLNADLAKRAAELSASNAELERFAYIASHDLQEPLRMVSSFLQLLQKKYGGQLDSKADQYIHYAVDGAERMKALIMDLLEYSRVGTGKEGFTGVDIAVVIKEVGDIFREKIIAARARVDIGEMPVVAGDKVQLTQLFQNLISNALKYHSDTPPVIRIRADEEPLHWRFSVEDNGIGIDSQFFDKIFIIFQRLHNKTDYTGTGIGLAICKKIVERHGGRIWVESKQDHGTTFYFTIHKKA
ncbi:MAG TPA: ATP-binding protein [Puia sp.]|jgi:PAS domain S-box-containing protein|nr:ATP-binding protein [Puia sp.]